MKKEKRYLTIEEQVSLCFPTATEQEREQKVREWKAQAARMAREPVTTGLMLFPEKNGKSWEEVLRQSSSVTTVV